jgi:RHS repeat-associated protein
LQPARAHLSPRLHWRNPRRVRRRTSERSHYNYFRDYDPAVGRYVEGDPIGLAGGSYSTYAYSNNNPVSKFDLLGLCSEDKCEEQVQKDEAICRSLPDTTKEQKGVRSRCFESANERYGECRQGKPLRPLVTWRESVTEITTPPPSIVDAPSSSWVLPGGLMLIFAIPWPGNPVYGGL